MIIVSGEFDPADLTAQLGVVPDQAHRKGEPLNLPRSRHPVFYNRTSWSKGTTMSAQWHTGDALAELQSIVSPFQAAFGNYVRTHDVSVMIAIQGFLYDQRVPSMQFTPQQIEWIHSLNATLDIDLINSE